VNRRARNGLVVVTTVAAAATVRLALATASAVAPSPAAPCISVVNHCSPTTTATSPTTTTEPSATTTTTEPETTTSFFDATLDTTPETLPVDVTPVPVETPTTTAPAPARTAPRTVVLPPITPAAVTGSYSVGLATILLVALGLIGLTRQSTRGRKPMHASRRWRFFSGLGCIALAGIVGIVGYLKLSLEPLVNRQIPYLASAGMALVLLAAVGGSLLVAEQLRTDDDRIEQLEAAVRQLADAVSTRVEAPARRAK